MQATSGGSFPPTVALRLAGENNQGLSLGLTWSMEKNFDFICFSVKLRVKITGQSPDFARDCCGPWTLNQGRLKEG